MPVAQFPGTRNWGYDGVYPFSVQASYGGPKGLKRLVDAAHAKNLAVVLDVVYNHIGPEGNYLEQYGHYFTDRYRLKSCNSKPAQDCGAGLSDFNVDAISKTALIGTTIPSLAGGFTYKSMRVPSRSVKMIEFMA